MRQKSGPRKAASESVVKGIRRATRKRHSAEEKIRIVLDGLLELNLQRCASVSRERNFEIDQRIGSRVASNYQYT